jgi:UDP-N-acetylglucosamine--N-acetylmuramyl-(pentapeptide) pyrophosphoryl-undecaprenol N-acetylglucosamine transferase
VRAVVNELKRLDPELEVLFVCDKAFEAQSRGLMEHAEAPVTVKTIAAGKLRRYHGVSLARQLMDMPTVFHNVIDSGKVAVGFFQSVWILLTFRPQVVFAKGGYVCLPLGLATRLFRIPLVIHDSDTRPGLTNRVLARFATRIATGSPLENYPYNPAISSYVGVPINPDFHPFSEEEQGSAKNELELVDPKRPLLVVTGGGLGSKSINDAIVTIVDDLIDAGLEVYHVTGKKHFKEVESSALNHPLYHYVPFVYSDMARVLGAADVVISRGSATFLQELAALKKPTIIIPAKHLGDQVKNAEVYRDADAAVVLHDDDLKRPQLLTEQILKLINDPEAAQLMAERLYGFARPDAALDTAQLIVEAVGHGKAQQD